MTHEVPLSSFRDVIRDGEEHGWDVEYADLWINHRERMDDLRKAIQSEGILTPILVGSDGRVWDGHHRVCVAISLGLKTIPITFGGEWEDE
jgi:hypothetical protein